jgi:poly-gamma-glutamate synthase PgsB/CapB
MIPIIGVVTLLFLAYLFVQNYVYSRLLQRVQYRVHVNGIRGKSSVTRYIASVFRAAEYVTYAKTTGTDARIIDENGVDIQVIRKGSPNVNEQVTIIRNFINKHASAIVVECMAINPLYQEWLQEKVIKSNISIITNVRTDHTDYMGDTLESIATSLSATIPTNGILITSEENQGVLKIFKVICDKKKSRMIVADKQSVTDEELAQFGYYTHKENVAIGLEVAKIIGLSRQKALKGMYGANPDPGNFRIMPIPHPKKQVVWVNLFAINDRESFISVANDIYAKFPNHTKVVILNHRFDRVSRVKLFTDIVTKEYPADKVITFGDFEDRVNEYSAKNGFNKKHIVNLGNSLGNTVRTGPKLFRRIVQATQKKDILLIGTVNIHTAQADIFLEWINSLDKNFSPSIGPREDRVYAIENAAFDMEKQNNLKFEGA